MNIRDSSLLRVMACCASFLALGVITRADILTGTAGYSGINASIPVIAGDHLQVTVTSSDLAPGDTTQVFLVDQNGHLVAVATGNGSNGSSIIDFTAPTSGGWTAVTDDAKGGSYQFNLGITGETGQGMPVLEQSFTGESDATTNYITIRPMSAILCILT
jgi:hypothetical protein